MKKRQEGISTITILLIIGIVAVVGILIYAQSARAPERGQQMQNTQEETMQDDMMEDVADTGTEDQGSETSDVGEGDQSIADLVFSGEVIAGSSAPFLDFVQADYEKALETDKLVVLYFYANWCPICRQEVQDALYPAFDELSRNDVVGFRINYNDSDTDDAERELAREFGVAYQHTKVFLKNGERVLKSPESWSKDRYHEEINNFAN